MRNIVDSKIIHYECFIKSLLILLLSLFTFKPFGSSLSFVSICLRIDFKKIIVQLAYLILYRAFVEIIITLICNIIDYISSRGLIQKVYDFSYVMKSNSNKIKDYTLNNVNPFLYSNKTRGLLE